MMRRFYIHNYRCFENFELSAPMQSSLLLIGPNGAGKSTLGFALEVLQRIARGDSRVRDLVAPKDLRRQDAPMRFEIEADIEGDRYKYSLGLELPARFRELRVFEEQLSISGRSIYLRRESQVQLVRPEIGKQVEFGIDWHVVALPIVMNNPNAVPISVFRKWLERMLILRPVPRDIDGATDHSTEYPDSRVANLGAWLAGLLNSTPSVYGKIEKILKELMPDFLDIRSSAANGESRRLEVRFEKERETLTVPLMDLSDGEKCFVIFALVIAANAELGPLLCFWDEPDNFLAPSEVGRAMIRLRQAFDQSGQFIATSHNPEAIRKFSDETTFLLTRRSHLEPPFARVLTELRVAGEVHGDLVNALIRGDLAP